MVPHSLFVAVWGTYINLEDGLNMGKKKNRKTNIRLIKLINDLKTQSREQKVKIWRDIAKRLEKPTRNYAEVNLSKINRYTSEGGIVLVPGKVLGSGSLDHSIIVAALNFSDKAATKIKNSGGEYLTIEQLVDRNPTGSGVKIMR
ncbi:MAG: 50S ribosomal protein L18e [Methanosarcinales archaeon]